MVVVEGEDGVELRIIFGQRWSEVVDVKMNFVAASVGRWRNAWEVKGGDATGGEEDGQRRAGGG